MTSPLFFTTLAALHLGAAINLLTSRQYALAICFICATVADVATIWVIK